MNAIRQRITDWQRERRIAQIKASALEVLLRGEPGMTRAMWRELVNEINNRSPQQVARMERRRGLVR